jgi:hypothetical protein
MALAVSMGEVVGRHHEIAVNLGLEGVKLVPEGRQMGALLALKAPKGSSSMGA